MLKNFFLKDDIIFVLSYDLNNNIINFLRENNYPPIVFEVWNEDWFKNERNELLTLIESLGYEVIKFGNYDHLAQHKLNSLNVNLSIDSAGNIKIFK